MMRHRYTSLHAVTAAASAVAAMLLPLDAVHLPAPGTTLHAAPSNQQPERGGQGRGGTGSAEEVRDTRLLAIGAAGSLELKTVSGDISVTAGTGRDVSLEVIKRVRRARTSEDVKRALSRVDVVVDHQGERASVSTRYDNSSRQDSQVSVSYVVVAPAGTRITAGTVSGQVTIRNIKGDVATSVVSGSIEINGAGRISTARTVSGDITVLDTASDSGMTIATTSGDVLLDRVRARRVDVETLSGTITVRDVSSERAAIRSLSGAIDFSGDLAKGGRYEFQSHSGDLFLALGGVAGFELQASTFSGRLRAEPGLALRSVSAQSRSLRGTAGDGSAVVVATTFSSNVVVGKK